MFIVVHAQAVPSHLKGYLDRFLSEVTPSLYVGNGSKRVADELWNVLVQHQDGGGIAMVLSTSTTEQGYEVRLSGRDDVQMLEFDGLFLPGWRRKVASHAH